MNKRLMGDITDFIFIKKSKKVLPIKDGKIIKVKSMTKCED